MLKFSILVAHYNNFEYFKDCYKSIISQDYPNFEVVILDDCSTDDSFEKVKELVRGDDRFITFKNEENKGVGYTKKKLIELATGDVCGFLDPDDAMLNGALSKVMNAYKKNKIVATYSYFYTCDEKLNNRKLFPHTRKIKNNNPLFFNIHFEVSHFFTFRRDIYLLTEGMVPEYKIAEDQDLYLKLYEKGDFFFIAEPLLLYRVHGEGLSQNKEKAKTRDKSWNALLKNALKRRNISTLYGKKVSEIENLPLFIIKKENTLAKRILRKLRKLL